MRKDTFQNIRLYLSYLGKLDIINLKIQLLVWGWRVSQIQKEVSFTIFGEAITWVREMRASQTQKEVTLIILGGKCHEFLNLKEVPFSILKEAKT